jgi:hypothetical protein
MGTKNKKKSVRINNKKVGQFLKSINEAERIYLVHTLNLSSSINRLIDKFDLSKEEVCSKFGIELKKYNDFVCGNYMYDLRIMSITNAWFIELETKALEDKVPVQIAGEKERKAKRQSEKSNS